MSIDSLQLSGIGMTSQRTRDRLVQRLRDEGIRDEKVLKVIANTPRHLFIDEALAHRAYEDTALPIGHGQTISQPYIVALMTETLLRHGPVNNVLEIGTGCGYQTAILAQLVDRVCSVERIRALHVEAVKLLGQLKIYNVQLRHNDGALGWPDDDRQFERIIMTAASKTIPSALTDQLSVGGTMVLPLEKDGRQSLIEVRKTLKGLETRTMASVLFVPLLPGLE